MVRRGVLPYTLTAQRVRRECRVARAKPRAPSHPARPWKMPRNRKKNKAKASAAAQAAAAAASSKAEEEDDVVDLTNPVYLKVRRHEGRRACHAQLPARGGAQMRPECTIPARSLGPRARLVPRSVFPSVWHACSVRAGAALTVPVHPRS